ncbi:hypothetical protein GCM10017687_79540 [Streptomyces echinatus]|uniref:hypothetical protein n=1 Tax=Streptomyces echinatus TaxID=67293 RepID=UPI0031ED822C
MSSYIAARIAAAGNDPAQMERCLVRADEIARTYELGGAFAIARLRRPMVAMAQGRFGEAEQDLASAVADLRARGAVDLSGLAGLAAGCIRLQQDRLAEVLPVLLAVWEQYQPHNEALTALALLAADRGEEAREVFARRAPIRRDFAYSILAGLRGIAAIAFGDRQAAPRSTRSPSPSAAGRRSEQPQPRLPARRADPGRTCRIPGPCAGGAAPLPGGRAGGSRMGLPALVACRPSGPGPASAVGRVEQDAVTGEPVRIARR